MKECPRNEDQSWANVREFRTLSARVEGSNQLDTRGLQKFKGDCYKDEVGRAKETR